ncbi:MAG TPA: PEP-CTERM sorting domain-containing protein [Phycisphaerae bacterium]|nr:PEP-CTERM sorting domain-containing protein [Phycisphaerae bacterium]
MSKLIAVAALLAFAATSSAAIVMTEKVAVLPTGETQYKLNFAASEGWVIGGMDVSSSGGYAIEGNTVQVLLMGFLPTPTMTNAQYLGADLARDTHFLVYDADIGAGTAPGETDTSLYGAWTITELSGKRAQIMDLVQIVVPFCKYVDYEIKVSHFNAELGTSVSQEFSGQLHGIPEPGTLALLGLGGLAAVLRRRRR